MKADSRIFTGRQDHAQPPAEAGQEHLEPLRRVGRLKLVQVVDHQHAGLLQRFEVREHLLDDRSSVEGRRRGDLLHHADGSGERVDHREPEALCIPLIALDRQPST